MRLTTPRPHSARQVFWGVPRWSVLIEIVAAVLCEEERIGTPGGVGLVAVGFQFIAVFVIFRNQALIGVEEIGAGSGNLLPQPPPKGIVIILGDGVVIPAFDFHKTIVGVVGIAEHWFDR